MLFLAWLVGMLLLTTTPVPPALRHLWPGAGGSAGLFQLQTSAAFLLFLAPFMLPAETSRRAACRLGGYWLLLLLCAHLYALTLAARVQPLAWTEAGPALGLLLAFLLFSLMLSRLTANWYYLVQGILAAGGPLVAWLFDEAVRQRTGASADLPALKMPSVFWSLGQCFLDKTPTPYALPRAAAVAGALFLLGALVCLLARTRRAE